MNISAIQWFPLYFWGFTAILTEKESKTRNILLLAAGLSGIALTSQYYLYSTVLISAIVLLIYLLFFQRASILDWKIWKQFLFSGLLSLPALAVGVVPYMLVLRGSSSARTLEDVMVFSASITDFVLPFTRQAIWGKWVWKHFPRDLWNEATLYLGVPTLALACLGFFKRKKLDSQNLFRIFLIGFLVSVILAMGTNLTWMEEPVIVEGSSWLARIFRNDAHLIYLPGYYFFKYVPFYSIMRAWMRIGVIAMVFNCAGAGLGLKWLIDRIKNDKHKMLTAVLVLLLVLVDFSVRPNALSEVKPREVDLWLAEQPEGGQVQMPFKQSFEEYSLYYTLYSQKPLLGIIRTFPSSRFFELDPLLKDFPDEVSVQALRDSQITYVVVDEDEYSFNEDFIQICEDLGLTYEISLDGQAVFTINEK